MGAGEPALDINERPRHDGPITLADYDDAWPGRFEREARRIRTALGVRALLVEHTGSTSVPRMAAKPIIDIVLAVPDSSDEDDYVPALEAEGYHLRIREPKSLEVCAMLYKPAMQRVDVPLRYVCFEIGEVFAVGYGLDYAGKYRNLPDIVSLKEVAPE